jgi:hypothetical protein
VLLYTDRIKKLTDVERIAAVHSVTQSSAFRRVVACKLAADIGQV